ncbi:hypothetical protein [Chromobacterium alticapitis]|uniref:hypothetical protein n=1 Tax=Chromobacterium alticapitis TaxID=2073169 RepID=UPI0011B0F215|nr:hypothetical protein [Chromobacterium alticapitis]
MIDIHACSLFYGCSQSTGNAPERSKPIGYIHIHLANHKKAKSRYKEKAKKLHQHPQVGGGGADSYNEKHQVLRLQNKNDLP